MSKKKVSKAVGMPVWLTRSPQTSNRLRAADCNYEVWVGTEPTRNEKFWSESTGCDFVTDLCMELAPRYMRKHGMTLKPGGGPLECVLTVKGKT